MIRLSPTLKIIKAEMERREIPVVVMAENIHIAASTLYRVLNGEFTPNFEVIENLVRSLNLKIVVKRN